MRRERPPANARRRTPDDDDDDDMSGATFAQRWLRPEVRPIATRRDATTTTTRPRTDTLKESIERTIDRSNDRAHRPMRARIPHPRPID